MKLAYLVLLLLSASSLCHGWSNSDNLDPSKTVKRPHNGMGTAVEPAPKGEKKAVSAVYEYALQQARKEWGFEQTHRLGLASAFAKAIETEADNSSFQL